MKRRDFLKVTGIGAAGAATLAAPAIAPSMPEIKWRLTASWPKSLDTLWGAVEVMSKAVAEATDNKLQLQTFAAGEIVPGLQVLDAVQNGTVEAGHTALYYYFGKDVAFTFWPATVRLGGYFSFFGCVPSRRTKHHAGLSKSTRLQRCCQSLTRHRAASSWHRHGLTALIAHHLAQRCQKLLPTERFLKDGSGLFARLGQYGIA